MNIYNRLNQVITYIEDHLEKPILDSELSKILGVNSYMMHRLFSLLLEISISDYIRSRRLSQAGYDLYSSKAKIVDIALKYQYESATSFSRAFTKFHGIKPSEVKIHSNHLKIFPRLSFKENLPSLKPMEYTIVELEEMTLYGKGIQTSETNINKDAPAFYTSMNETYGSIYGNIDFGMVVYQDRFLSDSFEYWILYKKQIKGFEPYHIPKSKWLSFRIPTDEALEIQKVSKQFYTDFVPSSKYRFKDLPELEYYHDGICDFLVPIED